MLPLPSSVSDPPYSDPFTAQLHHPAHKIIYQMSLSNLLLSLNHMSDPPSDETDLPVCLRLPQEELLLLSWTALVKEKKKTRVQSAEVIPGAWLRFTSVRTALLPAWWCPSCYHEVSARLLRKWTADLVRLLVRIFGLLQHQVPNVERLQTMVKWFFAVIIVPQATACVFLSSLKLFNLVLKDSSSDASIRMWHGVVTALISNIIKACLYIYWHSFNAKFTAAFKGEIFTKLNGLGAGCGIEWI